MLPTVSSVGCLLDLDATSSRRLRLGHDNAKDAVLKASLYVLVVDASGEAEGAVELAYRALRDPVVVLWLLLLLDLLRSVCLCDLGGGGSGCWSGGGDARSLACSRLVCFLDGGFVVVLASCGGGRRGRSIC